jgi:hypothetical protein
MAYAIANSFGQRGRSLQPNNRDALEPMRGIIAWSVISALVFWLPLGLALVQ